MSTNRVNLFEPIYAAHVGPSPAAIRVVVTDNNHSIVGGVPQAAVKVEHYVSLSVLPKELQERVKTVLQALAAGM